MNKGDELIERGAQRLQEMADSAAAKGGRSAKMADMLAEDAVFLRKLKPSLIKARAKGNAPTDQAPATATVAPRAPQLGKRPKAKKSGGRGGGGGPNPFVIAGIALATGIALAKFIDWRGHAHPRD